MKKIIVAGALGLSLLMGLGSMACAEKPSPSSTIPYWSVWTDNKGMTHQTRCALDTLILQNFSVAGDPEWVSQNDPASQRYVFNIMPKDWVGSWHKNPMPQWIIPLSGQWFVKTTDGKYVEMGPGDISFGGDQAAQMINGQEGHQSGSVDHKPAKVIVVQLNQPPADVPHQECAAGGFPIQ